MIGMKPLTAILIAGLAGFAAGCTSWQATADSWAGQPLDDLVATWGPPASVYDFEDGRRSVSYTHQRTGIINTGNTVSPTMAVTYECAVTFMTDRRGLIVSSLVDGNLGGCNRLFRNKPAALLSRAEPAPEVVAPASVSSVQSSDTYIIDKNGKWFAEIVFNKITNNDSSSCNTTVTLKSYKFEESFPCVHGDRNWVLAGSVSENGTLLRTSLWYPSGSIYPLVGTIWTSTGDRRGAFDWRVTLRMKPIQ